LAAPDLGRSAILSQTHPNNPLAAVIHVIEQNLGRSLASGFKLSVTSAIPIASGLGSGAAISVAVIRALAAYLGLAESLPREAVSRMAFEVERLHHGTPSGVDNTVIAYEQPVYFVKRQPENLIMPFSPVRPFRLVIGDTGVRSATKDVVGDVRRQWEEDRSRFEAIFDACGRLAEAGHAALLRGDLMTVGALMNENQEWLAKMTVSSPLLDSLVAAARAGGALGAKLSGAGRGGNMIALVTRKTERSVAENLVAAGAVGVYTSDVGQG
jgi:mevalonate kinase